MIIKRNLNPKRTLRYTWKELVFVGVVALGVCVLREERGAAAAAQGPGRGSIGVRVVAAVVVRSPAVEGSQIGAYRIERTLGTGGFGVALTPAAR